MENHGIAESSRDGDIVQERIKPNISDVGRIEGQGIPSSTARPAVSCKDLPGGCFQESQHLVAPVIRINEAGLASI